MRETKFIEQNQEKWADFEEMLRQNHRDPERLNDLFVQITDDLSYARTYYPNRSVRMYLNGLAQRIFHNVYRGKRFPAKRFRLFWTDELPHQMWDARRALWLSFGIFALACGIGVVSSIINPDFARVILGDSYVDMTLRNIEGGDPMAVYKDSPPLGMSIGIAANNLFVALRTAIFGVLASIGTVFMLLYNGIMLGAFQFFFIQKGLFWESFLTIWIHGTLEISAIIIAGAAGLVAGSGLLFPGTYTRRQAFQLTMRRGLKIFIGLIPMFVLAAFFEGFLTRYTETPAPVRFFFILSSLVFVLWYFVWLPWHKSRTGFHTAAQGHELPPTRTEAVSFTAIKGSGEIFADAFALLLRYPQAGWGSIAAASVLFVGTAVVSGLLGQPVQFVFPDYPSGALSGWWDAIGRRRAPAMFWGQAVLLWGLFWAAIFVVRREMPEAYREQWGGHFSAASFLTSAALTLLAVLGLEALDAGLLLWLLGIGVLPFLGLWMAISFFENSSWRALPRMLGLMRLGSGLMLGFLIINFALLLFLFLDSSVWQMVLQFFSWMVPPEESAMATFTIYSTALTASFVAHLTWFLLVLAGALQYFSYREITDAVHLREGIGQVGAARQIRGLARE
ncbi:MAG: stage II sporulation protein M [Lewinellaceae bacterium]|nr:stage II sporulation protein M [Lewinellaceae bacterium]